jgi:hypothetical protein
MGKKDKKLEKKLAKKAAKAAIKKAKKDKTKEIAAKAAVEMAEKLRAEREAALDVEELLVEDAVAVVEETEAQAEKKPAPAVTYEPVEGDKLKTVSIKMPESLVEAADKAAAAYGEEGISRSEFIRLAIEKLVNEQ